MFNNRIITYSIENNNETNLIPENFLSGIKFKAVKLLSNMIQKNINIKFNLEIFCEYMLVKEEENCAIVLNIEYLTFSLPTNNIKDFEMKNRDISVNVFGLNDDNDVVGPYYSTINEKAKHVNLMLLEDGERFHYVWIKNISR